MLFEHLAANDDSRRVTARKAVALARARANNRFSHFLDCAATAEERETRLALVAGELTDTVRQACADCDHSDWYTVLATIQDHLGMQVESRRPKMCPVHREITDISLQQGDPQSGFSSMSQHLFGDQSCRGSWDGNCNFKPEMTTQSYWDGKNQEAEERQRQREETRALEPAPNPFDFADPDEFVNDGPDPNVEQFSHDWNESPRMDNELQTAPEMASPVMSFRVAATVENPIIHGGSLSPIMMIAQKKPGLMINGMDPQAFAAQMQEESARQGGMPQVGPVEVSHPHPEWEGVVANILSQGHDGPLRELFERRRQEREQQAPMEQPMEQAPQQPMAHVVAEALKHDNVDHDTQPKLDKAKWGEQPFLDTEGSGSPHPTRQQDIKQRVDYTNDLDDQTRAVTESQELPSNSGDAGFNTDKNTGETKTKTWNGTDGLANPVTMKSLSASDPVTPKCPKCGSHTTGLVSRETRSAQCARCKHEWSLDTEVVPDGLTDSKSS